MADILVKTQTWVTTTVNPVYNGEWYNSLRFYISQHNIRSHLNIKRGKNTINKFITLYGRIKLGENLGAHSKGLGPVSRATDTGTLAFFLSVPLLDFLGRGHLRGPLYQANLNIQAWGALSKRCQWLAH